MGTVKVCIRVDIDTVRDVQVLPHVLDILREHDMIATFFITTGTDNTYRNYKNYRNPLKLIKKKAFIQHGPAQMIRGLFHKQNIEQVNGATQVIEEGHELGLHGYDHYHWMNTLCGKSQSEIEEWITLGCKLFREAFGYTPTSFSSPGFTVDDNFLAALDTFDFEYSSDFRGNEAFYPNTKAHPYNTLQLPVALKSIGEMEYEGQSDDEIYHTYVRGLEKAQSFMVIYMHPSFEPIMKKQLLNRILDHITANPRFENITMQQLAKSMRKRAE